jgi:NAD(P)H-nitrite reductase large subunit
MSRSRRKTPILGTTTAESERYDKKTWHRAFRRAIKNLLSKPWLEEEIGNSNDIRNNSSDWNMSKDGKTWYHNATDKDMRK